MLTEQAAERLFRAVRAVLGGENFTLSDFFRRCDRVVAYSILRVLHEDFVFPEHASSWKWDEAQRSDLHAGPLPATITPNAVISAIMDAKLQCISDTLAVGVDVNKFKSIYHLDDGTLDELDEDEELSEVHEDITVPPPAEAVQIVTVRYRLFDLFCFVFFSQISLYADSLQSSAGLAVGSTAAPLVTQVPVPLQTVRS